MTVGWRSPLGGPRYEGDIPGEREENEPKWPEARIEQSWREYHIRQEAEAVAGPEDELRADGGNVHTERVAEQLAEGEDGDEDDGLEDLHVGDHVRDRENDDGATMLVVGLPLDPADEHSVGDATIADFNPEYPADDDVVEVVYPSRTDVDVQPLDRYGFPRSRLELVTPVHERGDDDE